VYAIEGTGLAKRFKKKRSLNELIRHPFTRADEVEALRGVDIAVKRGEIFGLLGPNGAGKTTLLKILSCLVLPDRGSARIDGMDVERENLVKRRIGLVHTDERSFYWRLSGRENLRFFARLYDVPGRRIDLRIDELLARVEMLDAADRPFSGYSSGMKQRVAICRALLHDPPILLMDEPTRSLDPASSLALRGFIRDQLQERDGKTILLASHNLREVEALADRIAILVRGRVRRAGTVDEIRRWEIDQQRYMLEFDDDGRELPAGLDVLDDRSERGARRITLGLPAGEPLDTALRSLLHRGFRLRSCERLEPDLEEAFTRILDQKEDEGPA